MLQNKQHALKLCPCLYVGGVGAVSDRLRAIDNRPYDSMMGKVSPRTESVAIYFRVLIDITKKEVIPKDDFFLATSNGLEPSTSSVTGWRANRLHHEAK